MELTQSYLKTILHYDPDTGCFTWLPRPSGSFKRYRQFLTWNLRFSGKEAGSVDALGYVRLGINGRRHKAHRLAFVYMAGAFPDTEIDHINGDKRDNRFANLRAVSRSVNQKNAAIRKDNISGCTGVSWGKLTCKWVVRITSAGRTYKLGEYADLGDAVEARKAAEIKYGFHPNHGRAHTGNDSPP